jgi:hypothetical protein
MSARASDTERYLLDLLEADRRDHQALLRGLEALLAGTGVSPTRRIVLAAAAVCLLGIWTWIGSSVHESGILQGTAATWGLAAAAVGIAGYACFAYMRLLRRRQANRRTLARVLDQANRTAERYRDVRESEAYRSYRATGRLPDDTHSQG